MWVVRARMGKDGSSGMGNRTVRQPGLSKRCRQRFHVKRLRGTSEREMRHREVAQ